jgi:diguanylate cyclase (GGDEF)-like protein
LKLRKLKKEQAKALKAEDVLGPSGGVPVMDSAASRANGLAKGAAAAVHDDTVAHVEAADDLAGRIEAVEVMYAAAQARAAAAEAHERAAESRLAAARVAEHAADQRLVEAQARERLAIARLAEAEGREQAIAERIAVTETRERAAAERDAIANDRDRAAAERDAIANDRDRTAATAPLRRRDEPADAHEAPESNPGTSTDQELELARLEAELQRSHLDSLTGALRREIGRLTLRNEIERARRGDGRFVVAFIDVDGLKGVNDSEGHAAGDRVLRTLSATLRANLRSYDPIVRYGGDEFVCGISSVDTDEVHHRLNLIDQSMRRSTGVGISAGVARLNGSESLEELTSRADAALLEAKRSND